MKIGDIIVVDADDTHEGSAALVTRVWEDGTVNLRVFADGQPEGDHYRTLVDVQGSDEGVDAEAQPDPAGPAAPSVPPAVTEQIQGIGQLAPPVTFP